MGTEPSTDDEWMRRINNHLETIDRWSQWMGAEPQVEPGSDLAQSDADATGLTTSTLAWSGIQSAVDHLGLVADALQGGEGGNLRPMAYGTVLRAALLAATQTVWLLEGGQYKRRVRTLVLEQEERSQRRQWARDYLLDGDRGELAPGAVRMLQRQLASDDEQMKRIRQELDELHIPERDRRVVATKLVKNLGPIIDDADPWLRRAFLHEWRTASGDAHGRLWQTLTRPGNTHIPLIGTGTSIVLTTGTPAALGQSLSAAVLATNKAFELWEIRTKTPTTNDSSTETTNEPPPAASTG